MRIGGILSVAVHVAFVAAGMVVAPALKSDPAPMIVIPLDLVTISDSTNIAPVSEKAKEDDKAEETKQPEQQAAAAPPPPPPETFVPDASTPPPPKKEPDKRSDAKQDGKLDQKDFLKNLNALISAADDKPSKAKRDATADKAANLRNVADAGARAGAGDMKRMTATVTDFIRAQLLAKGCWTDHDDMADARRLRAVIRVRFTASGHFLGDPQLVDPREPSSDPPMQAFIGFARTALDKCNRLGFQVPQEYFQVQPAQYIDIEFLP
ncbi:MAG TPA: hypothetical protein VG942_05645 [Hyphomonadaceae bacterium]|nr:hypothetical protein [Hyphomonadaceae bacterium]